MKKRALLLACVLMMISPFVALQSLAQGAPNPLVGTLNIQSQPHFAQGKLEGCTLVYSALYQDWTYRQGALLKVDGSIGVVTSSKKLATILKVVVNEAHFDGMAFKLHRLLHLALIWWGPT